LVLENSRGKVHHLLTGIASLPFAGMLTDATAAQLSPGCNLPPPAPPPEVFQVSGVERQAIVAVPTGHPPGQPHPLVFAFHGRTNDNAAARAYFDLEEAAKEPTIFVYPAGLPDESGRFTWSDPADRPSELRDYALFDAILDRMEASYCIDLDRVFVVGHSLGASFANSLACARGNRVRAHASVAGSIIPSACSGEVAALLLHNPQDRLVPLSEGERARDVLLGEPGKAREPAVTKDLNGFACRQYAVGETKVVWCIHTQNMTPRNRFYPHLWPKGAADAIMKFFAGQAE
jgi:polyhydroxybutyrate depolymerase